MMDRIDAEIELTPVGTDGLRNRFSTRLWYRRADEVEPEWDVPANHVARTTGLLAPGVLEKQSAPDSLEVLMFASSPS